MIDFKTFLKLEKEVNKLDSKMESLLERLPKGLKDLEETKVANDFSFKVKDGKITVYRNYWNGNVPFEKLAKKVSVDLAKSFKNFSAGCNIETDIWDIRYVLGSVENVIQRVLDKLEELSGNDQKEREEFLESFKEDFKEEPSIEKLLSKHNSYTNSLGLIFALGEIKDLESTYKKKKGVWKKSKERIFELLTFKDVKNVQRRLADIESSLKKVGINYNCLEKLIEASKNLEMNESSFSDFAEEYFSMETYFQELIMWEVKPLGTSFSKWVKYDQTSYQ